MNKYFSLAIFSFVVLSSCSPQRSNPVNAAYHDLTAHYNSYWIANEHIKVIEQSLHDSYEWNYNKILPIYVPFDSTDAAGLRDQTQDCIKKASISIQYHPDSKWEYPAYILVGKARYYSMELPDAVESFKYVNTKSENNNVRHEALANLMKTFTLNKEYNNALAVVDYLTKEKLNTKNEQLFYMNQAYLHQERGDLNSMVKNLTKAEELFISSSDKARIQFILGQVYQHLGFNASAFYYYEKSLKSNPSYELSFYTKLNMAQVTELSEGKDVKTVQKYFKKLLVDRKNLEYNDKIYYEMGLFEEKTGNLDEAISNFETSIRVGKGNNRQEGLSYLQLARVYYDSLKNFELSKLYYDSAVSTLPKDEDNFAAIQNRQEILIEFVKHKATVSLNDSLLHLAKLPPDSLKSWAINIVNQDSLETLAAKEEMDRILRNERQQNRQSDSKNDGELIALGGNGTWYFDNPSSVSQGSTNFQRKWKNRTLEDHWRRATKIATVASAEEDNIQTTTEKEDIPQEITNAKTSSEKVKAILASVPTNEEEQTKLQTEIMDALYEVGNIYNFRLLEKENAIASFNELLRRFPQSPHEPEVLYQLYLLQQDTNPSESKQMTNRLSNIYPESIYAQLIDNPNFREESFAATIQLQEIYKSAYSMYRDGNFNASRKQLDSALLSYPDNEFSDNIVLLRILNTAKIDGQHMYQFELDNFVKTYENSELLPYVNELISTSQDYKLNLYSSSKANYSKSDNQSHYFLLVYKNSEENGELATGLISEYLRETEKQLKYGNILLSENHSMVAVRNLKGKTEAMKIHDSFKSQMNPFEVFKGQEYFVFVISEQNFDQLYKTKDIESYNYFFDKNYL